MSGGRRRRQAQGGRLKFLRREIFCDAAAVGTVNQYRTETSRSASDTRLADLPAGVSRQIQLELVGHGYIWYGTIFLQKLLQGRKRTLVDAGQAEHSSRQSGALRLTRRQTVGVWVRIRNIRRGTGRRRVRILWPRYIGGCCAIRHIARREEPYGDPRAQNRLCR